VDALLEGEKMNLEEVSVALAGFVEAACAQPLNVAQVNLRLKELAQEVRTLFATVECGGGGGPEEEHWLDLVPDQECESLRMACRMLQERLRPLIQAVKDLHVDAPGALGAVLRASTALLECALSCFFSFESAQAARMGAAAQDAAPLLAQVISTCAGKAPADEFPQLRERTSQHLNLLARMVQLKAVETPQAGTREKLRSAAGQLVVGQQQLWSAAEALLASAAASTPDDTSSSAARQQFGTTAKALITTLGQLQALAASLSLNRPMQGPSELREHLDLLEEQLRASRTPLTRLTRAPAAGAEESALVACLQRWTDLGFALRRHLGSAPELVCTHLLQIAGEASEMLRLLLLLRQRPDRASLATDLLLLAQALAHFAAFLRIAATYHLCAQSPQPLAQTLYGLLGLASLANAILQTLTQ
jgi:hypothetical protein